MAAPAPKQPDRDMEQYAEQRADDLVRRVSVDADLRQKLEGAVANNTFHLGDVLKLFNADELRRLDPDNPQLSGALAEERATELAIQMLERHATAGTSLTGPVQALLTGLITKFKAEKIKFGTIHTAKGGVTTANDDPFNKLYQEIFAERKGVNDARALMKKAEKLAATHGIKIDTQTLQAVIDDIAKVTHEKTSFDAPTKTTVGKIKKLSKEIGEDEKDLTNKIATEQAPLRTDLAKLENDLEKTEQRHYRELDKIDQWYDTTLPTVDPDPKKGEIARLNQQRDAKIARENKRYQEEVRKKNLEITAKKQEITDKEAEVRKMLADKQAELTRLQGEQKTHTVYTSAVPYSQLEALKKQLADAYDAVHAEYTQSEKRIDALKKRETREAPAATKFSTIDVSQYEKLDDIKTYDELIQDAYRTVLEGNSMPAGANQMRDAYLRLAKEHKIPTTLNSGPISGYLAMVAECERLEQALAQQGKSSEYARKFLDDIRNNEKHPFVVLKKLIAQRKVVRDAELEVARLAGSGNPVEVDMANQKLANEKRALRDFEVKMLGRSKANAVYTYLKKNAAKLNTTDYEMKNHELNQKIAEINGEIARLQGILNGEESKTERARLEERIMFLKRTLAKLEQIALQRRTRQEAVEAHNDQQKLRTNVDEIYKALQEEFNSRFIEKGAALGFVKGNFQKARMRMGGVWEVNFFGKMIKMPFFGNKLRRMAELIAEKNASTNTLLAQYRTTELKRSPWRRAEGAFVQWSERNFLRSQQKRIESMQASIDRSAERLLALEKKKMDKYEKYKEKHGQSAYIEERISLREREHQAAQAELKKFTDPKYLKEPKDDAEIAVRVQQREAAEETMYKEFMDDLSKAGITETMYPKERFTDPTERKEALKLYFGRLAVSRYPEGLKRLKVFTDFLKAKRSDIAYQFSATHFAKIMKYDEDQTVGRPDNQKMDFTSVERCERFYKDKEKVFVAAHPDRIFTPSEFFKVL